MKPTLHITGMRCFEVIMSLFTSSNYKAISLYTYTTSMTICDTNK